MHLANHVARTGNGIVNVMTDLACLQAQAGHEVIVASGGGSFESLLSEYGVRHVYLPQSKNPVRLPAMMTAYWRLVRSFAPDIVHAHMMTGAVVARLGAIARSCALVTTVHNEFQKAAIVMGVGDRVVAVSDAVRDAMQRRGVAASRMAVVRNGTIGSPRLRSRGAPEAIQLERPAIVTVAGMYTRKGIFDLAHAFAKLHTRLPAARLYYVGDGPDRAACEALIASLGLGDAVRFTGFVDDPRAYMRAADVFVLASHADPCPLVIGEAREAGCAVVATNVGGIPESLEFGAAGVLVPPSDPDALGDALLRLAGDERERERWRSRAMINLGWLSAERVGREYLGIYAGLLAERQRKHRDSPAIGRTNG
jgi:glycosyltransferase involved in cell wall biosynthesis